tara:strand:- start:30 stop:671 length:642 start_codon:yes stop_codon:yes gene_type:complete
LKAKDRILQKELAELGTIRLDFRKIAAIVQLFNQGYKINSVQRGQGAKRLQSLGFSTTNFYTLKNIKERLHKYNALLSKYEVFKPASESNTDIQNYYLEKRAKQRRKNFIESGMEARVAKEKFEKLKSATELSRTIEKYIDEALDRHNYTHKSEKNFIEHYIQLVPKMIIDDSKILDKRFERIEKYIEEHSKPSKISRVIDMIKSRLINKEKV